MDRGERRSDAGATYVRVNELNRQISKFWTIEEIANNTPKSRGECECKSHFMRNVTRNSDIRKDAMWSDCHSAKA